MSKKDLTQKALLRLPDVFASLINFLIFDNCPVIHPDQICPLDIPAQFDYDSSLNPVYRDASAMVLDPDGHPSFIVNFENQTAHDPTMPIRAMGYTDTAYFWQRSQLIKSSRPSLPFSLSRFVLSLTIVLETVRFKLYNELRKHCVVGRGADRIDRQRFPFYCRLLCPDAQKLKSRKNTI